jgi:hypothetical protein
MKESLIMTVEVTTGADIAAALAVKPPKAAKAPKAAKPPREPKAPKAPKAAKPPRETKAPRELKPLPYDRLDPAGVIRLGSKNGAIYSPENPPFRPGSDRQNLFALARDGMTVAEAESAGLSDGKVRWYVTLGLVTVEAPAVATEPTAQTSYDEEEAA